jgi:hypothetical protein
MEIPVAEVPGSVVGNACMQLPNMLTVLYTSNTDGNAFDSDSFHERKRNIGL